MKTRLHVTPDQIFGDLVGSIRAATSRRLSWAETAELVAGRLRAHLPSPDLLTAEQRYGDPLGYRCHVLHTESDGSFSIVALVWRPGQVTPIHDHVTWCVTAVIQGCEHEDRYVVRDGQWLEHTGTSDYGVGTVSAVVPPGDIHRVRNDEPTTTISLHVYGTDLGRMGSSVRRTYDLPVVSDLTH
jgi:3-mercaptopropionate dioxygenase